MRRVMATPALFATLGLAGPVPFYGGGTGPAGDRTAAAQHGLGIHCC
ncbi:hypothetical protein [Catellatospora tritici]|nr:hypothetical protein [Catellatospora tritici]MBV1854184.1 hypothetical protein [Catellatospora tritici]